MFGQTNTPAVASGKAVSVARDRGASTHRVDKGLVICSVQMKMCMSLQNPALSQDNMW